MWVFLNNAFLSIVQDKDNPDFLMVRARLRGDLERTFSLPGLKVDETPAADYRFRARIRRNHVSLVIQRSVIDIDYTNFKKSVPDQRRHDAYLRVWSEMWRAQQDALPTAPFRDYADPSNMQAPNARCTMLPAKPVNSLRCDHCLHLKQECMCMPKKPVNPPRKKAVRPR